MSDFNPLFYAVGILFLVGGLFPFAISFFVDPSGLDSSGVTASIIDVIENGFELGVIPFVDFDNFDINPFSWLGSSLQSSLVDYFLYIGLLPDFLIVAILIFITLSVIYTIIKLLPTT